VGRLGERPHRDSTIAWKWAGFISKGHGVSQLFDYFACSRRLIERWADALADGDEDRRQQIEAEMPGLVTLKRVGQDEFNVLAACVAGDTVDVVQAVGQMGLVQAVSPEEGPWVIAFRRPAIEALAGMRVDEPLVARWARHLAALHGGQEDYYRRLLTAAVAGTFGQLCGLAVERELGVFVCFHG
jgi:hypothetical protein